MLVLFLDIDGVVNCASTKNRFRGFLGIDKNKAELVRKIVNETGCSVVLSSTWRLDDISRDHVRKNVCDFIDVTGDLSGTEFRGSRGEEIRQWIIKHPDVTRSAILDDDSDFYADQPLFKTRFIGDGLTPEIADLVIKYLNISKR